MTDDTAFKKGRLRKSKSKSTPIIGSNKWTKIIEDNLKSTSKPSRDRMFASSAALCPRQSVGLQMIPKEYTEVMKASSQFYFGIGNTFEDIIGRAFNNADLLVDKETRVEATHPEMNLSGRVDFVIRDPDDENELVLVELKSCGKLPTKPKPAHLAQLMTYLCLTGMSKGLVWYVSRNVADYSGQISQAIFEVTPTKAEKKKTIYKLARSTVYSKHNILPGIPLDMKKYKCGFCPLIPHCWEGTPLFEEPIKSAELGVKDLIMEIDKIIKWIEDRQDSLREQFIEVVESW